MRNGVVSVESLRPGMGVWIRSLFIERWTWLAFDGVCSYRVVDELGSRRVSLTSGGGGGNIVV